MRESAALKGRRYLTEGRVILERVDRHAVVATARGDGHVYRCGWSPLSGWHCTCAARGRCSHLVALGLVTAVDIESGMARHAS
ncbi:MAG: hypothetical protein M3N28_05145 [Actinomycetota bacterium]|nr:hypothetical protein [Actinomycetota bacterium]